MVVVFVSHRTLTIFLVWALTAFVSIPSVQSEKSCYTCMSGKSLEHCEMVQRAEVGCGNIANETSVCFITERRGSNGKGGYYGKHCIAQERCNRKSLCAPNESEADCQIYCCTEHNCNRVKFSFSRRTLPSLVTVLLPAWLLCVL